MYTMDASISDTQMVRDRLFKEENLMETVARIRCSLHRFSWVGDPLEEIASAKLELDSIMDRYLWLLSECEQEVR